jgi:hypothetical protein
MTEPKAHQRMVQSGYDSEETETDVSDEDDDDNKVMKNERQGDSKSAFKFEAVSDVTPDAWKRTRGRIFVCNELHEAVQVVEHTKCFVKVRTVPTKPTLSLTDDISKLHGASLVDWTWVKKNQLDLDNGKPASTSSTGLQLTLASLMQRRARRSSSSTTLTYCVARKGHRFYKVYAP